MTTSETPLEQTPFLKRKIIQRVVLFILAFLLISGLSGSWLISTHKLLFPFYFSIYGSAGKSLLFGLVVFLLLTKDTLIQVEVPKFSRKNLFFAIGSVVSLGAFFLLASNLLHFTKFADAPSLAMATHSTLWLAGGFATLAVFSWEYLLAVAKKYPKELLASIALGGIFYFLFGLIFQLWPYLSHIVLWAVSGMLSITNPGTIVYPPLTIHLPQFAITIGEYCSGIESLFLITTLYILIGCLEWKNLRKGRYVFQYFPLILGMFGLNIIRVYLIIESGLVFGPEIAAKLFHTYLGMILFMSYFFLFWKMTSTAVFQPHKKETL